MRTAMIVAMAAILSACGGGGGGDSSSSSASAATPPMPSAPAAPAPTQAQLPSQLEIAQLLYSDSRRTPAGFGQVLAASTQGYQATVHLKNVQAADLSQPRHELCTDDWNEALQWSDEAAALSADLAEAVENNTTEQVFEFVHVSRTARDSTTRLRVFRCDYLDRQGVDLRSPEGFAGKFNKTSPDSQDLRELAEYLWTFTSYNNFGTVVLKSEGATRTGELEHTLTMARLARAAVSGSCDDVEVFTWRHVLDSSSGTLMLEIDTASTFKARQVGGLVEVCQG